MDEARSERPHLLTCRQTRTAGRIPPDRGRGCFCSDRLPRLVHDLLAVVRHHLIQRTEEVTLGKQNGQPPEVSLRQRIGHGRCRPGDRPVVVAGRGRDSRSGSGETEEGHQPDSQPAAEPRGGAARRAGLHRTSGADAVRPGRGRRECPGAAARSPAVRSALPRTCFAGLRQGLCRPRSSTPPPGGEVQDRRGVSQVPGREAPLQLRGDPPPHRQLHRQPLLPRRGLPYRPSPVCRRRRGPARAG